MAMLSLKGLGDALVKKESPADESKWFEGYTLELLDPEEKDFDWVYQKMMKSFDISDNVKITKIWRVKNSTLWEKYSDKRVSLFKELGALNKVTEARLFHGSPHSKIIAKDGFKLSLAKEGPFGRAIYFSELACQSDKYCKVEEVEEEEGLTMLVCRVALGKVFKATGPKKILPKGFNSIQYGSTTAVYDESQVYPGFMVEYTTS